MPLPAILHKEQIVKKSQRAFETIWSFISVEVDGARWFLRYERRTDLRGSHYGQVDEKIVLLNQSVRLQKKLRRRFVREYVVDECIIEALKKSPDKIIERGGESHNLNLQPWE